MKSSKSRLSFTALLVTTVLLACSASCGSSVATVKVRNNADATSTTISVSTGNGGDTQVNVSPKILSDSVKVEFLNKVK